MKPADNNPFSQVPIEVTISVGKARPLVKDLLRLRRDAVLATTIAGHRPTDQHRRCPVINWTSATR